MSQSINQDSLDESHSTGTYGEQSGFLTLVVHSLVLFVVVTAVAVTAGLSTYSNVTSDLDSDKTDGVTFSISQETSISPIDGI